MATRKPIAKDVADKLLVDAMHRCCLCPEHHDITDKHHIVRVADGGPDTEDNLMVVDPACHAKIHRIKAMYNEAQLRTYKERWIALCALGLPLDARIAAAFDVRQAPLPTTAPPLPDFVHPYPLQDHFTGRLGERKMLTDWLTSGRQSVFALVAIGGMGKSALTWAWVQRDVLGQPLPGVTEDECQDGECGLPQEGRPEGILWWSFYEREAGFATFLDEALRYAGGGAVKPEDLPSGHDKLQRLLSLLGQRRILLVLDGFERELRAYSSLGAAYQGDEVPADERSDVRGCVDPLAGEFLRRAAAIPLQGRILLTSRLRPKELEGHDGLPLAGCHCEELENLRPEDAVTFFHALKIKGTRAEIEAACEPLGYHPLALRLLAGAILRDARKPGDMTAAARHPVIEQLKAKEHHILQVAYEILQERQASLLSRIAAFRGPVSFDMAAVLNTYGNEAQLEAALEELVARGLLLPDTEEARYDLHPVVRRYAYQRLSRKIHVHTRLRDYFAAAPTPHKDEVHSVEDLASVIELYHHTVRAWRYEEACDLLRERLVPQPLYFRFGAYETIIQLLRSLFPDGEDKPPRLNSERAQAWTLNELANCLSRSGQPRSALPLLRVANALDESGRDNINWAIDLGNMAAAEHLLGEMAAAEAALRRSITLCRERSDSFEEAGARQYLGLLLAFRGRFAEAESELEAALARFEEWRAFQAQSVAWCFLSLRALLMGDTAAHGAAHRALDHSHTEAREDAAQEGDFIRAFWLLGWSHTALAAMEPRKRDAHLAEAEAHLTEALTRCRRINLVEHEADILLAWARWHQLKGGDIQARTDADDALYIADRCDYRLQQADIHNFLAQLNRAAGDRDGAAREATVAYERAWCDGPPFCYKPALDEAERMLKDLGAPVPELPPYEGNAEGGVQSDE